MKVQLPQKSLLSRPLAIKAASAAEFLTKKQVCDCIEAIAKVPLSKSEKRQSKSALLHVLVAALPQ
jgi:hypothetical protein